MTLEDMKALNNILLRCGADITEMNCIRKHLSKVKGGMLSKAAFPARVVSLILSDVIGDRLDVIASGPTAPDPTTFADAMSIIKKYGIKDEIPGQIYKLLEEGFKNKRQETMKDSDEIFLRTTNLVIGSNRQALIIAKEEAESSGYDSRIITDCINGDVEDVANKIVKSASDARNEHSDKRICLLFGGEPTVKVKGKGSGGRNQHLALICANMIKDLSGITILCGGTDGTDGPTDATGAVVDSVTTRNAGDLDLNIETTSVISTHIIFSGRREDY